MTQQDDKDNYTTYRVTQYGQDATNHTTDVDGFVRSLELTASVEVTVSMTVGGTEVANYVGSDLNKGEFGDPIAEIGAEETVEVTVAEAEDVAVNLVVDEYKG